MQRERPAISRVDRETRHRPTIPRRRSQEQAIRTKLASMAKNTQEKERTKGDEAAFGREREKKGQAAAPGLEREEGPQAAGDIAGQLVPGSRTVVVVAVVVVALVKGILTTTTSISTSTTWRPSWCDLSSLDIVVVPGFDVPRGSNGGA